MSYADLCNLFNFTEGKDVLRKDETFYKLTKEIFGEDILGKLDRVNRILIIREQNKIRSLMK